MKKNKIIGLGVCALALGVVAGAVSAKRALEVKADEEVSKDLYLRGGMNDWGVNEAYKFTTTSEEGFDLELKSVVLGANVEWKIANNAWSVGYNYDYSKITFQGNDDPKYFTNADGNVRTYSTGGTFNLFLKKGNDAITLKVVRIGEAQAVEMTKWELVGDFTEWADKAIDMPLSEGWFTVTQDLVLGNEFKLRANGGWTYSLAQQIVDKLNNENILSMKGANVLVNKAGTFTLKVKAGVTDAIINSDAMLDNLVVTFKEAEAVYTAKLGDAALPLEKVDFSDEDMAAQYKAVVTAKKGAALTLYLNDAIIKEKINSDEGSSFGYTQNGIFTLKNDVENAEVYIKLWKSGWITVWSTQYVEYTGYYLLGASGSWDVEAGIASNGASGLNVATFINVSFAKDAEFTIGKFIDGSRDAEGGWTYDVGWSDVNEEYSDAYAKFEAGESDNHIKVKTAGKYCIYVNAERQVFLNDYVVTEEDRQAVRDFIASYITEQAKDPKEGDSCDAKYNAAATALAALNEVRQDLFLNDAEFATARATFEYWRDHRQGQSIYTVEGVTTKSNTTLVISLVASGLVAAAGIGIFFATRKKKAE